MERREKRFLNCRAVLFEVNSIIKCTLYILKLHVRLSSCQVHILQCAMSSPYRRYHGMRFSRSLPDDTQILQEVEQWQAGEIVQKGGFAGTQLDATLAAPSVEDSKHFAFIH